MVCHEPRVVHGYSRIRLMNNKARRATQEYHIDLYKNHKLFQKGSSWLEKPNDEIVAVVKNNSVGKRNIKVLDLGSGVGRNAIPIAKLLKKKGVVIHCVDYLQIAIDKLYIYAKKHDVAEYIKGFVSPIEDFKIKRDFYDYIIAHSVLAHAKNKETMIRVIKDMAKGVNKNGIAYIYMITNPRMYDAKTRGTTDSDAEVNISYKEASGKIKQIFTRWNILTLKKNPYEERYQKDGREVVWKSDYLLFIAKK